ncbi:MAG: putative metal-binding motif-containing protein [Polyangiaceae bacterium]
MRRLTAIAGLGAALIWSCASGSSTTSGTGGSGGEGNGSTCTTQTWYRDSDGDSYGDDNNTKEACDKPMGYVDRGGDCDDMRSFIRPGAEEDCASEADYNCDGSSGYSDLDMDGVPACEDCNDQDPSAYPGADEICDGVDNDCDELIDLEDETDAELCPAVPNSTAICDTALCFYSCVDDWFDVNQDQSDGCECQAQPTPATAGNTCANAVDLGNLTDVSADSITVSGNAVEPGRSTWYVFTAVDDLDTAGDEFHVDGRFANNPGNAYVMSVFKGACPDDGGAEIATDELSSFDWYVDFNYTTSGCTTMAPCGEGNCSATPSTTVNLCNDDTSAFYVEVHRLDGQASCDSFDLQLSNGVY